MLVHDRDNLFGRSSSRGFTLVELTIVIVLSALISTSFLVIFKTNLFTYLNLQNDSSNFTQAAYQTQRVSTVLRGLTDVISANDFDLQVYAYFYPQDAYVSQIRYYTNTAKTQLLADVTPMTANPPSGTPITGSKKTFTIIDNFRELNGTKLFVYLDASNATLSTPVSDLSSIKAINISLAVATTSPANQVITTQVSLRNRKTNL